MIICKDCITGYVPKSVKLDIDVQINLQYWMNDHAVPSPDLPLTIPIK